MSCEISDYNRCYEPILLNECVTSLVCLLSYNINGLANFETKISLKEFWTEFQVNASREFKKIDNGGKSCNVILGLQETKVKNAISSLLNLNNSTTITASSLNAYAGVASLFNKQNYEKLDTLFVLKLVFWYYDNNLMSKSMKINLDQMTNENKNLLKTLLINEGRINVFKLDNSVVFINCYVPARRNCTRLLERSLVILFLFLLVQLLAEECKLGVVLFGDFNAIYNENDSNSDHEELELFKILIAETGVVDVFADIDAFTFWLLSENNRIKNIGSRLDYIFYKSTEKQKIKVISKEQRQYNGYSDHDALFT